jgi:small subunit ribosomal protein S8
MDILKVLKEKKFITDYKKEKVGDFDEISVTLSPERADMTLKRVSKPGQRIYVKSASLRKVNGGLGVSIVSTPKGVMTGDQAKRGNLGGEVLCEIY